MTGPFPQQPASQPGRARSGHLIERFVARLLDGLIVGIPMGVVLGAVLGVLGLADETIGAVVVPAVVGVALLAYYVHFESTTGQTIGKKVMSLRTTSSSGGVPDQQQAIKRNVWIALSIFSGIPVLGILTGLGSLAVVVAIAVTIGGNALGRGLHDEFAGTTVVRDA
ncbi:RDD family protein [Nocardioides alcanivorans]|uniref:RDD family protein n=1 Tax=Nocardioides alcanivorans TaxID=2897352 RepID=UPI001F19BA82|nr:RDD family protein [Nocardioides alcanivorans]